MKKHLIKIIIVLFAIGLIFIGYCKFVISIPTEYKVIELIDNINIFNRDKIRITNLKNNKNDWTISGIVKNTRNEEIKYVQVNINHMDTKGSIVGTSHEQCNSLKPGEVFNFERNYGGFCAPFSSIECDVEINNKKMKMAMESKIEKLKKEGNVISGKIKNVFDEKIDRIEVRFEIFNNNNNIDFCYAEYTNFLPGETWIFETYSMYDDFDRFEHEIKVY